MTDGELHAEAVRLASLDDEGFRIEQIKAGLRLARQSSQAMDALAALDREMLRVYIHAGENANAAGHGVGGQAEEPAA